jgi:hypothetical protein
MSTRNLHNLVLAVAGAIWDGQPRHPEPLAPLSDADVGVFGSTARSVPQLDRDVGRQPAAVN